MWMNWNEMDRKWQSDIEEWRWRSLQNWAARIIFKVDRRHDPTFVEVTSLWLPVKERIMFKILFLVYKTFHDQVPIYILKNCFELYQPLRPNLRSSTHLFRICCPRTRTKAGDRTFTVTAAKPWNKLPTHIKSANSLEIFKKLLNTHLFPKHNCSLISAHCYICMSYL